jgi:hypothetical protein
MLLSCSNVASNDHSPLINNDMSKNNIITDTIDNKKLMWEEYHPSHTNSDFFIIRIYDNGSYQKYSNTVLSIDGDSNPIYTKTEYKWRELLVLSEEGIQKLGKFLAENITSFSPKSTDNPPGGKDNSILKAFIEEKEYIIELPNQNYDKDRYAFFQKVNDLVYSHIKENKSLTE